MLCDHELSSDHHVIIVIIVIIIVGGVEVSPGFQDVVSGAAHR